MRRWIVRGCDLDAGLLGSLGPADLPWALALVLVAGAVAGAINAVVGSGTLITFPVLLLLGMPPVMANVSNTLGLVPGAAASVWEYRATLVESRRLLARLVPFTVVGAIAGSLLLVVLPSDVFDAVVPVLIAAALVAILLQPWIQRAVRARLGAPGAAGAPGDAPAPDRVGWIPLIGVLLIGAYGGYFGAAQGILLLVTLSIALGGAFGQVNGVKNVLGGLANLIGSIVFLIVAWQQIDWIAVLLISVGSVIGGAIGARSAKRLPPLAYRIVVLAVGAVALVVSVVRLVES